MPIHTIQLKLNYNGFSSSFLSSLFFRLYIIFMYVSWEIVLFAKYPVMVCWIASYKILFDRDTSIRTDCLNWKLVKLNFEEELLEEIFLVKNCDGKKVKKNRK